MARLTEEMVIARSKQSDLASIKKLNCWGAELGDVSVLRKMPNVEVLALSVNKLSTLRDFAGCRRLRELYMRRNEVRELNELRHLRPLTLLTSLWLDENPCSSHPLYRHTVLRNLPNLEKLDNIPVDPDEVAEAQHRGIDIPDSDEEGYAPQESYKEYRAPPSIPSSPEPRHEPEPCAEWEEESTSAARHTEYEQWSPRRRSPERDDRYQNPAANMTRSHYERGSGSARDDVTLRHSYSAQSVKEYAASNGEGRPSLRDDSRGEWERREAYSSAVMAERQRPGFTRRPVTRNSNLLSAVLCLVKELDYPSLEVAEMAVRCRMDELASNQL